MQLVIIIGIIIIIKEHLYSASQDSLLRSASSPSTVKGAVFKLA